MKKGPNKRKPVRVSGFVDKQHAPSAIVRPTIEQTLEVALSRTTEASQMFGDRLIELQTEAKILQSDLANVRLFERIGKAADEPTTAFKGFAKALLIQTERLSKAARGPDAAPPRLDVETGRMVLSFEDNRKVTVAWKEEAIRHAKILHAVSDALDRKDFQSMRVLLAPFSGTFDATVWEAAIKAGKEKTGALTPKIVEG